MRNGRHCVGEIDGGTTAGEQESEERPETVQLLLNRHWWISTGELVDVADDVSRPQPARVSGGCTEAGGEECPRDAAVIGHRCLRQPTIVAEVVGKLSPKCD